MIETATRRRKLGPAAIDTLDRAAAFAREHGADAWFRPKDVGGARGNNVGSYLTSLRERGLIWRREAKPSEWRELKMWEYRITAAGWAEKEAR